MDKVELGRLSGLPSGNTPTGFLSWSVEEFTLVVRVGNDRQQEEIALNPTASKELIEDLNQMLVDSVAEDSVTVEGLGPKGDTRVLFLMGSEEGIRVEIFNDDYSIAVTLNPTLAQAWIDLLKCAAGLQRGQDEVPWVEIGRVAGLARDGNTERDLVLHRWGDQLAVELKTEHGEENIILSQSEASRLDIIIRTYFFNHPEEKPRDT